MDQKKVQKFIIGGAPKAGTTAVFEHLGKHDEVCGSNIKETLFFLHKYTGDQQTDQATYRQFFDHMNTKNKVLMEATASYIYGDTVPIRIREFVPDAKLLFILRDPIDRVYSLFNFKKGRLEIPPEIDFRTFIDLCLEHKEGKTYSFEDYLIRGVTRGNYGMYLTRFYDNFPSEQIKVMFFENFKLDPESFMFELCDFLDLSKEFFHDYEFYKVNQTFSASNELFHKIALRANTRLEAFFRRRPYLKRPIVNFYKRINEKKAGYYSMQSDIRSMLSEYYAEDREVLQQLLRCYSQNGSTVIPPIWDS